VVRRSKCEEEYSSVIKDIIEQKSKDVNAAKKKIRTALYASDIYQCQRKVFYQFFPDVFNTEDIDGRTARIFANGEDVHVRLSSYLKSEERIEFEDEVNIPRDNLDVHGRCDGIALIKNLFFVVEFKSINKIKVTQSKEEHQGQLQWYLGMWEMCRLELRNEFGIEDGELVYDPLVLHSDKTGRTGKDLSSVECKLLRATGPVVGEIIYECKPNQNIDPFLIECDSDKFQEIKKWFTEVKNAVDSGIRPEVKYDKMKFPCNWYVSKCSYWDYCHGEDILPQDYLVQTGRVKKEPTDEEVEDIQLLAEAVEQAMEDDDDCDD
jgi:hypothetical protein